MKKSNAVIEQTNAKFQRIFYNIVEQRRKYFLPSVKQAVRISNNTLNRRTRLTPSDAVKKIKNGEKVQQRAQKAGKQERQKSLPVGTKVRALKKGFSGMKGGGKFYKSYKADHFEKVLPITAVRYYGKYPKYKVGGRWVFADEIIKSRPEDTKSHQLVIKRPLKIPGREAYRKPPKALAKFAKGDKVYFKHKGRRLEAEVKSVAGEDVTLEWQVELPGDEDGWSDETVEYETKTKKVPFDGLTMKRYQEGTKVLVRVEGDWRKGVVQEPSDKDSPFDFHVSYAQNNKRYRNEFKSKEVKPRKKK